MYSGLCYLKSSAHVCSGSCFTAGIRGMVRDGEGSEGSYWEHSVKYLGLEVKLLLNCRGRRLPVFRPMGLLKSHYLLRQQ